MAVASVPAMEPEECARRFGDLYQAAVNGPVMFRHLVQARWLARSADPIRCTAGNWLTPRLAAHFAAAHGDGIEKEYYCSNTPGGCLLAADRTVYCVINAAPAELADAEVELKVLAREAAYGLRGRQVEKQLEEATDHVYSALTRVLVAADLEAGDATESEVGEAIAVARTEYGVVRERVEVLLERQARVEYFQGVLCGVPPTFLLVTLFGLAAAAWWERALVPSALVAAIAMSALGATISVIQRMANGGLVIDRTASVNQRRLLGAFRPGIGAIFGALAYFTLLAGVLAGGAEAGTTPASVAVFALAGFAAGFSERFATDMLEQAGKLIKPKTT